MRKTINRIILISIWLLVLGSFVMMIGTTIETYVITWKHILNVFGGMIVFIMLTLSTLVEFIISDK